MLSGTVKKRRMRDEGPNGSVSVKPSVTQTGGISDERGRESKETKALGNGSHGHDDRRGGSRWADAHRQA